MTKGKHGATNAIPAILSRNLNPAAVKTTSILAKAHVLSAGFAPSDTGNLQVGMEVEHERFGFGKVISIEGKKPDIKGYYIF